MASLALGVRRFYMRQKWEWNRLLLESVIWLHWWSEWEREDFDDMIS
jgi:hypothetical protein